MERPLHVLLLHQLFATGSEAGGTRHWELGRHLAARGERVTAVAGSVSYLTGERHVEASPTGDLRVLRAWTFEGGRGFTGRVLAFLAFASSSFLKGLRVADVDVVWGTSPPIFQAVSAWAVARLRRVPFVLEVRDLWPDFAVALGVLRNPLLVRASRALEGFLYRAADRVVVNSPGFVDHVVGRGAAPEDVVVVPNGVDAADFDPDSRGALFRREVGARDDQLVVLYAGAHGVPNDLDVVLDAAQALRSDDRVRFVLVGGGRERERLRVRARDLRLENVVFHGAVPKERMGEVLAAADVGLAILRPLDLFRTTYPNKVFDYMAAGRPTLLAIDGVIREVVEEAGAGLFVQPGDPRALA
ncbi:MAG: glycosyltransferase family 4 protein, partial [Gemmatimonadetes bacterium]|nr:glycosyltransferase family 4 protein [Gemmatimonadota bacterium]